MHSRFDTEARIAVAQAADIARELGHTEVGPDHLLLGLLANARGTAYAALTDHGLRLDAAREIVAAQHVDPVDEPETDDAETTRPRRTTRTARPCVPSASTSSASVRPSGTTSVRTSPTAGPRRPERGRRGGRGRRGRGRHHHPHHDHEGRGRRGPRSRRGDGPRFSRELRGLLRDVRHTVLRDRFDDDRSSRHDVPGMSGARLLVALTRSEDPVVRAVLAGATDLDGLRRRPRRPPPAPPSDQASPRPPGRHTSGRSCAGGPARRAFHADGCPHLGYPILINSSGRSRSRAAPSYLRACQRGGLAEGATTAPFPEPGLHVVTSASSGRRSLHSRPRSRRTGGGAVLGGQRRPGRHGGLGHAGHLHAARDERVGQRASPRSATRSSRPGRSRRSARPAPTRTRPTTSPATGSSPSTRPPA